MLSNTSTVGTYMYTTLFEKEFADIFAPGTRVEVTGYDNNELYVSHVGIILRAIRQLWRDISTTGSGKAIMHRAVQIELYVERQSGAEVHQVRYIDTDVLLVHRTNDQPIVEELLVHNNFQLRLLGNSLKQQG